MNAAQLKQGYVLGMSVYMTCLQGYTGLHKDTIPPCELRTLRQHKHWVLQNVPTKTDMLWGCVVSDAPRTASMSDT